MKKKIIEKIKNLGTDEKLILMGVMSIGTGVIINTSLMKNMHKSGDYYDVKIYGSDQLIKK